jgi:hypothetical protein
MKYTSSTHLVKLNLQLFAEEPPQGGDQGGSQPPTNIASAFDLEQWNDQIASGEEPPASNEPPQGNEPPTGEQPPTGDNQTPPSTGEQPPSTGEQPPASTEPPTGEQPPQTPEQNAAFAQKRREAEEAKRLEDARKASPEYKALERLAGILGQPVDAVAAELEQRALAMEAQRRNVPIEVLQQMNQQQEQITQLQTDNQQKEFKDWQNRIEKESTDLKTLYPFLTDEDMTNATVHLVNNMRNVELPLSQAVWALHGDKMATAMKQQAEQEALAKISGRKADGQVPPSGTGTNPDTPQISDTELALAKRFGMTADEYIKNRDTK